MLRPYLLRGCSWASIEACALLSLRFGSTCFGLAYPAAWQRMRSAAWGWRAWFPRVQAEVLVNTEFDDIRRVLYFRLNDVVAVAWCVAGPKTTGTPGVGWFVSSPWLERRNAQPA